MSEVESAGRAGGGPPAYPFDPRHEMLELVPVGARRVLDVGCGRGGFGWTLGRGRPAATLWGLEPEPDLAAEASAHYHRVVAGAFPEALPGDRDRFDCIVFNDVLEHLADPWDALGRARRLLGPGGAVVASVPNVRNARTLFDLAVRGDWTYVELGVLDRTHLRFFTRRSMVAMFDACGYRVEALVGVHPLGASHGRPGRMVPRLLGELAYTGFGLRARPR